MIAQVWRLRVATLCLIATAACSHNKSGTEEDLTPRPDPIPVHVRNENFLDMNVYALTGGVQHRLGTVTGNGEGDFTVAWDSQVSSGVALVAIPIGGSGRYTTQALNVGEGQMVVFRIAPLLRQSTVVVADP
ncbi:MAG TPA: hypothetical protein VGM50_08855 [Gemmatimonadaceae bacterium]|jgi:hypothetical protein